MAKTLTVDSIGTKSAFKNLVYISKLDFPNISELPKGKTLCIEVNGILLPATFDDSVEKSTIEIARMTREKIGYSVGDKLDCKFNIINSKNTAEIEELDIKIELLASHRTLKYIDEIILDSEKLKKDIKKKFSETPISKKQVFLFEDIYKYSKSRKNHSYKTIVKIDIMKISTKNKNNIGKITDNTNIEISIGEKDNKLLLDDPKFNNPKNKKLLKKIRYKLNNVGGHKKAINDIIKDVFLTRTLPKHVLAKYNIKLPKGVLLYGPSGTGKTLIAREIGKMFTNGKNIHVVKGPELLNKYVGGGESKLREVFSPAINGKKDELHIFIFDELEALFASRKKDNSNTQSGSKMTSTLLNIMDGVDKYDNFVIFGLTNLKENLDEALLRPGRFGLHCEIGLPKLKDRLEILKIQSKPIFENKLLDKSVDLAYWAKKTENWSGAELTKLVSLAGTNAASKNFVIKQSGEIEYKPSSKSNKKAHLEPVTQKNFEAAYSAIKPLYVGNINNEEISNKKFFHYSDHLEKQLKNALGEINGIESGASSVSIVADDGCGKTSMARYLAAQSKSKASYSELINYNTLKMMSINQKRCYIEEVLNKVKKSDSSILIFDNIEDILGANPNGYQYSNSLRTDIKNLLNYEPEDGKKVSIILTSRKNNFLKEIEFNDIFNVNCRLKKVETLKEVFNIFNDMKIKLSGGEFTKEGKLKVSNYSLSKPLPIKKLLHKINMYKCKTIKNGGKFKLKEFFDTQKIKLLENKELNFENQEIKQLNNKQNLSLLKKQKFKF